MNNLKVGNTYTNRCDDKEVTCTVKALEGDRVTVHVSNSDMTYVMHREIFGDTMHHLGFTLRDDRPALYRIYYINNSFYADIEYEYINEAIRAGKEAGFEFAIHLGDMVCCAWSPLSGLRFYSEYQRYAQDQLEALNRAEGAIE